MAITCCTSPGRGPKVRRFRACTARFCSFEPASAGLSFFLANNCGTAQARLRHRSNSATRVRLGRIGTPRKDENSFDYEPGWGKKLLPREVRPRAEVVAEQGLQAGAEVCLDIRGSLGAKAPLFKGGAQDFLVGAR